MAIVHFSNHTTRLAAVLLILLVLHIHETNGGEIQVVTTVRTLKSITDAVGGKHVSTFALTSGQGDPHYIPAKPSYMIRARKADLWIRIGLDIEIGFERLILEGSRNPKIQIGNAGHLDTSLRIRTLGTPTGVVDRSRGDIHPFGNPHYWLDPFNARIMAYVICARLKQIDSVNAKAYDAGLKRFLIQVDDAMFGADAVKRVGGKTLWKALIKNRLSALEQEKDIKVSGWVARMAPLKGKKVVTHHKSWIYFTNRFGLLEVGEIEPKPGVPPSPKHLAQLIKRMKQDKVKVVLIAPYFSPKAPNLVAAKTGAKVLQIPNDVVAKGEPNGYVKMIDNIITQLTAVYAGDL